MNRNVLLSLVGGLFALGGVAQLVPYRVHNPPVSQEPAWDSPKTAELARRACYDCHSNETKVPWYGQIAPAAWLVRFHVDEGREHFNMSEMNRKQKDAHEAAEMVEDGEMPPGYYTALHPEARLGAEEREQLISGLAATFGGEGHEDHDEDQDHDDR